MSESSLLTSFIAWASMHQQQLLNDGSPYVTRLQVGKATNNRSVSFSVECFKIEKTGWIGDHLEQGGILTVWENGCADADWAYSADLVGEKPEPSYQQHWDGLVPAALDSAFAPFTSKFKGF